MLNLSYTNRPEDRPKNNIVIRTQLSCGVNRIEKFAEFLEKQLLSSFPIKGF